MLKFNIKFYMLRKLYCLCILQKKIILNVHKCFLLYIFIIRGTRMGHLAEKLNTINITNPLIIFYKIAFTFPNLILFRYFWQICICG